MVEKGANPVNASILTNTVPKVVDAQIETPPKKRAREDGEGPETDGQGSAKKIDAKEG